MVSISDMPDEVLLLILAEAASSASPGSILNCVLVSKWFARVTIPLLYRHINDETAVSYSPRAWWGYLIKTLLSDPAKISWIQRITVEQASFWLEDKDPEKREMNMRRAWGFNQAGTARIEKMIDETFDGSTDRDAEKRKRWREECLDRKSRIHCFALLMPRMSNLRDLTLVKMTNAQWDVLAEGVNGFVVAKKRAGEPRPLRALEYVGFGTSCGATSAESLAIVATWPDVKHISMSGLLNNLYTVNKGPQSSFLALRPRSTALKTLRLANSAVHPANLTELLGSAQALETFEYGLPCERLDRALDSPEISRALSQQRHSLTKIMLQLGNIRVLILEGAVMEPMDFSSFKRLKQLVIAPTFLFGRNHRPDLELDEARAHILKALPACLEELCISQGYTDDENAVALAALLAVIQSHEARYPMLKRMKWECRQKGKVRAFKENEQALREIAEETEVRLTTFVDAIPWSEKQRMSSTVPLVSPDAYCTMSAIIDVVKAD